jgi:hypothetical protein
MRERKMDGTVTLGAIELLGKSGFDDGDVLDDILEDAGYDWAARPVDDPEDDLRCGFAGAVLGECVRRHLAPRLQGFEIHYDLSISHNPVRLADRNLAGAVVREALEGVEVRLSHAQVLAVAAELAPGYVDVRPVPALPRP